MSSDVIFWLVLWYPAYSWSSLQITPNFFYSSALSQPFILLRKTYLDFSWTEIDRHWHHNYNASVLFLPQCPYFSYSYDCNLIRFLPRSFHRFFPQLEFFLFACFFLEFFSLCNLLNHHSKEEKNPSRKSHFSLTM